MLKQEFLKDKKCKICGVLFNHDTDNKNYRSFCEHTKRKHNISLSDYYLIYYLDGKEVLCACGCGKKTKFHKGNFFKYYSDHKNHTKPSENTKLKILKYKEKENEVSNLIKKLGLNVNDVYNSYNKFINLEKPISVLSKELLIDFRTLKSYWIKLGLIQNLHDFNRLCLKSKVKWMTTPIKPDNEVLEILKSNLPILKKKLENKYKLSFNDIINTIGINVNKNYLSYYLKEVLTSSELKSVKFVKHSQIEIDFLTVLRFYFGKSVQHNFELDGKFFDYKLCKKILIELDGEYWHSSEESKINDKLKNEIAKNNNFILIRVSDKQVKKIDFLTKLKKIYDENK